MSENKNENRKTFYILSTVFFLGVLTGLGVATVLAILVVKG